MNRQIKKIQFAIILFLFTAITVSYAGMYVHQTTVNDRVDTRKESSSSNSEEDSGYALFRTSSTHLPGRPDTGNGVGQGAPIGDGVTMLTACCLLFVVVKLLDQRRKKRIENKLGKINSLQ
ncbi:MAG: hypothetical protein FWF52_04530 [Candidatus Azobacteroides sp.]|nr:hypothetical protein [Candidatus Azobacteroides sp.]